MSLYVALLFFVLVPGVVIKLPVNGSRFMSATVHAVIFAVIFHFTHKAVWGMVN
jgi:hypothetical protein